MNALNYLLPASAFLLAFYGGYWLLRRNTFFGLNRAYLLVSIGLSLVLPLVNLPDAWVTNAPMPTLTDTITLPTVFVGSQVRSDAAGPGVDGWLWLIYSVGVGVMLVRLLLNVRAVFRLINTGTTQQRPGYTLVCLPETGNEPASDGRIPDGRTPSFSFGRYLVLNAIDAQTEPDALMRHEEAHIRQYHTVDVLFVEIMQAVFWFNPVLWGYKHALQEIHEFLADRAASDAVAPIDIDYPRQLVAYALNVTPTALVTPFVSVSTLKQRIVMLKKPQSNRRALLQYALVLPIAGLLTLCTQPDRDQPATEAARSLQQAEARKPVTIDGEIFSVVEQQPVFPGGMAELGRYLSGSIKYPEAAQRANVSGRVFVNFVVTKTGEITDVNLLKGIGFGADEEARRVVSQMPRWIPGKQNGKAVNVKYNLPINFSLDDKESSLTSSPPPIPVTDESRMSKFTIDGKEVTKEEVNALDVKKIFRVDTDEKRGIMAITTRK